MGAKYNIFEINIFLFNMESSLDFISPLKKSDDEKDYRLRGLDMFYYGEMDGQKYSKGL